MVALSLIYSYEPLATYTC